MPKSNIGSLNVLYHLKKKSLILSSEFNRCTIYLNTSQLFVGHSSIPVATYLVYLPSQKAWRCAWLTVLMSALEEWRFVMMTSGTQCVTRTGL